MTSSPPNLNNTSSLTAFTGLVGVLAIFLFFTGWVYRWAYFGFFEIELNSLNLPPQSFLIVPIQVILGDLGKLGWSFFSALMVIGLIKITLWLLQPIPFNTSSNTTLSKLSRLIEKLHRFPLFRGIRWFTNLLPNPLLQDLIVVVWILIILFWLARLQGYEDARLDAINQTSNRPIITLVGPSDKLALGATLDDKLMKDSAITTDHPQLKNMRIIGDVDQLKLLYPFVLNRSENTKKAVIWRLLIESGNWLYIFSSVSDPKLYDKSPLVLAINTGDGRVQSLILSRPKANIENKN
jgi:hypothetical protein